jgi:hypothetical protein
VRSSNSATGSADAVAARSRIRGRAPSVALCVHLLVAATANAAPAAPAVVVESRRAFVVEQLLRIARLETGEGDGGEIGTPRGRIGAPLVAVKKNLQAASLALARADLGRFDQLRAEIASQMEMVDALLSQAEVEASLARAEAQLAQTAIVLTEAEARARAAEDRLRQRPPAEPSP